MKSLLLIGTIFSQIAPTLNIPHLEDIHLGDLRTLGAPNRWQPSRAGRRPFAGLQGGAVASLLTAEVEALAEQRKWGTAISASAWFLRPTPMAELRTDSPS